MKKIVIALFAWFFIINLMNVVSFRLLFDKTSYELPKGVTIPLRHLSVPWLNFDGRNYLKIVTDGYDRSYVTDLRVFFPMYPLAVRTLSLNLMVNPIVVGLAISLGSFTASLFLFDALMRQDRVKDERRFKTILSLLVFPTSFFFAAFYTEGLFLLLVLSFFYFLNKKNILAASVLTAVATATRVTGLALVVPLLWEAFSEYKRSKKIAWQALLAPLGFIVYSLYIQFYAGGALSIVSSQKNWNKPLGLFGPFVALRDGLFKFLYGSQVTRGDFFGRSMEILEFTFAVILIALVIYSFKRIKTSYWLYFAASIVPIFFSGVLSSVHRYMAVMFPIYLIIGILPKKYFYLYMAISSILLLFLTSLFLRNYWVA